MMTTSENMRVPLAVWILALAALSPFFGSAGVYAWGPVVQTADALTVLLAWSTVTLSFIGGIRWGMEIVRPDTRAVRLAASVAPAVIAWGLLLAQQAFEAPLVLGGYLAAFIGQWLFDHAAPDTPARYPTMMTLLTGGACVALAVALEKALSL